MSRIVPILVLSLMGSFIQVGTKTFGTKSKWQQISLLRSTREDVEALLGKPEYEGPYTSYKVADGVLSIEYYPFDFCTAPNSYLNVRRWTVVEMTYQPDNPPTLGELKLKLKRFRKVRESPDVPQMITYIDDKDGVAYTFQPDNTLSDIRYFLSERYNALHCKKRKTGENHNNHPARLAGEQLFITRRSLAKPMSSPKTLPGQRKNHRTSHLPTPSSSK